MTFLSIDICHKCPSVLLFVLVSPANVMTSSWSWCAIPQASTSVPLTVLSGVARGHRLLSEGALVE